MCFFLYICEEKSAEANKRQQKKDLQRYKTREIKQNRKKKLKIYVPVLNSI